ncbi:MAG TPA: hypothetical protein VHP33_04235 [Polyangiaceae bacterium]|nr:hypothetical protein [Polyangiaceae bacterium]
MANASARRSFHGPLLTGRLAAPKPAARAPSRPLELVPPPPSASSLGRAVLAAARVEAPTTSERERILASVLTALQRLTNANR